MINGVLPETFGRDSVARYVMIYDWIKPVGPEWLGMVENIFSMFNQTPTEGTGHLGDKHSYGNYKRVRKRLGQFLEASVSIGEFDIRVLSEKIFEEERFFPSNLCAAFSLGSGQQKRAIFAARSALVVSVDELTNRIGSGVFGLTGEGYGGAWDFPVAFCPESYLASVGAIPKGVKLGASKDYSTRIARWRDNIWHRKLHTSQGYFREIYPINFLLEVHLNMPFRDRPLAKFMDAVGTLQPFEFNEKMYRWDVPAESLDEVRDALEPSGLVLSSDAVPLRIH